jgi:undecaprenyl-phosphate galactose phosphotransferase/putative colanic acid biosynthesis UDP-glucose lipid carrier transferase
MSSKFGYSKYLPLISGFVDVLIINMAFFLAHYIRFQKLGWWPENHDAEFWFLSNFLYLIIAYYHHAYDFIRVDAVEQVIKKFTTYFFIYAATIYLFLFSLNLDEIARLWVLYYILLSYVLLILTRWVSLRFFSWYRAQGRNYRRIVIVGTDTVAIQLFEFMNSDVTLGYRILGFFDFDRNGQDLTDLKDVNYLGDRKNILKYLSEENVHEVFWKLTSEDDDYIKDVIGYCEDNMIRIRFIPYFGAALMGRRPALDMYNMIPVATLRPEPLQIPFNRFVKRGFDLLFSSLVLLLIVPVLFPVIALLIKISSKGPVFFKQERTGEQGNSFWCWKFRTMMVNSDADTKQATLNDQRITVLGRWLRKTNLDELPQFFNVWNGDMSVVGPRPHMLKHTEDYRQQVTKFLVRHLAKPGITGWAQVNGFRGETKQVSDMERRVEADIWYVENWSLLLDLRIIFKTILNMIRGEKNAY